MSNSTIEAISRRAERAANRVRVRKNRMFYTFADKAIVPTFLTRFRSRTSIEAREEFLDLHGQPFQCLPIFGASMSFMRSKVAIGMAHGRGVHILPRVGVSDRERIEDVVATNPHSVGASIKLSDSDAFLKSLFSHSNLRFASIDIAHGANKSCLYLLDKLARDYGIQQGVIVGNVGSLAGVVYLYRAMKLLGYRQVIIKVGVGPGSACTTRLNTGVGVGQLTLLEDIYAYIQRRRIDDLKIIADGGLNTFGDICKALARSHGVMTGRLLASDDFEGESQVTDDGHWMVKYYGMASDKVPGKKKFIEGGETMVPRQGTNSQVVLMRMSEAIQSSMSYVNARTLREYRENVRFALNSNAAIIEGGIR